MPIRTHLQRLVLRYLDRIYQDTVRERYKEQTVCLENDPSAVILDLGCHTGVNTLRLAGAVGTQRALGLECDARALRQAAVQGIACVEGNAERPLPFLDDSVDVVTAMDVLEHLSDPRALIHEIHRVLRPGGYCLVATPNSASWHNVFALVLGLQPFSGPNLTSMLDADLAVVRKMHRRAYGLMHDTRATDYESVAPSAHCCGSVSIAPAPHVGERVLRRALAGLWVLSPAAGVGTRAESSRSLPQPPHRVKGTQDAGRGEQWCWMTGSRGGRM